MEFSELIDRVESVNFSMTVTKEMLRDLPYLVKFDDSDKSVDLDEIIFTICDKNCGIRIDDKTLLCNKKIFQILGKMDFDKVLITRNRDGKLLNKKVPTVKWARQKYHRYGQTQETKEQQV